MSGFCSFINEERKRFCLEKDIALPLGVKSFDFVYVIYGIDDFPPLRICPLISMLCHSISVDWKK